MTLGDWSRTELDQATASRRGGPGWRRHLQLELVELTSSVPRAARTPQPSGFTANLPEPAPVTKGNTASPAVGAQSAERVCGPRLGRVRNAEDPLNIWPAARAAGGVRWGEPARGKPASPEEGPQRPPRRGAGAGSSRRRGK